MKLVDIFDTRYFAAHWSVDLIELFEVADKAIHNITQTPIDSIYPVFIEAIQEWKKIGRIELDLAEACICSRCMDVIMTWVKKDFCYFSDSVDMKRDLLLQELRQRIQSELPEVELPIYNKERYRSNIGAYTKTLSASTRYYLGASHIDLMFPLAVLLLLKVPALQIDFGNYTDQLFREIHTGIPMYENVYQDYYIYYGGSFLEVHFDGEESVVLGETISFDHFKREYMPIPARIGKEDLSHDEAFKNVFKFQMLKFNSEVAKRRKTLADYF